MDDAGGPNGEYDGLLPKRGRAGRAAGALSLPVLKLALLGCFLTTCLLASRYFSIDKLELLLGHLKADPTGSFYIFLACFVAGIVLMLPGMVLSVGAGAVYGFALGCVITWLATVMGQTLAFLLGRYLLRDFVVGTLLKRVPNFGVIEEAMSREGWKLVVLLRLSPLVSGGPPAGGSRAMGGPAAARRTQQLLRAGAEHVWPGLAWPGGQAPCPLQPAAPRSATPTPHPSAPTPHPPRAQVPYNMLNYALSVTSIEFWAFTAPSALAIVPYVCAFVYVGSMSSSIVDVMAGNPGDSGVTGAWLAVSAVMFVVTGVFAVVVSRRALAAALKDKGGGGGGGPPPEQELLPYALAPQQQGSGAQALHA
jgi:uncharacterized membrane protein YdjX (TVP38/TMEM64 family)